MGSYVTPGGEPICSVCIDLGSRALGEALLGAVGSNGCGGRRSRQAAVWGLGVMLLLEKGCEVLQGILEAGEGQAIWVVWVPAFLLCPLVSAGPSAFFHLVQPGLDLV